MTPNEMEATPGLGTAFHTTGQTRRTAIWNYYEVECSVCLSRQWVAAGSKPKPCGKCEAARAAKEQE